MPVSFNPSIEPQSSALVNMPNELFKLVLPQADFRDIESLSCTCRQIHEFIDQPSFWKWLADQNGYKMADSPNNRMEYEILHSRITTMTRFIDCEKNPVKKAELQLDLLKFCSNEAQLEKTRRILEDIVDPNIRSQKEVEFEYIKPNEDALDNTVSLLTRMPDTEWKREFLLRIIEKYLEIGLVDKAIPLFNQLDFCSPPVGILKLMEKLCELGKTDIVETLLPQIKNNNLIREISCLLIAKYVESCEIEGVKKAKSFVDKMGTDFADLFKHRSNTEKFVSKLIDKYCKNCEMGSLNEGLDLLCQIGLDLGIADHNLKEIMHEQRIKYGKKETQEKFEVLLRSWPPDSFKDVVRDLIWTAGKYCDEDRSLDQAVELMIVLPSNVYEHYDMTCSKVIKKCCKKDLLEKAEELLAKMPPDSVYNRGSKGKLFKKYCENNQLDKAEKLLAQIPADSSWKDNLQRELFKKYCENSQLDKAEDLLAKISPDSRWIAAPLINKYLEINSIASLDKAATHIVELKDDVYLKGHSLLDLIRKYYEKGELIKASAYAAKIPSNHPLYFDDKALLAKVRPQRCSLM